MAAETTIPEPWNLFDIVLIERVVQLGNLLTFLTFITAIVSGIVSIHRFRRTIEQASESQKSAHYSELDKFYSDILLTGIEFPYLRTPNPLSTDEESLHGHYTPYGDDEDSERAGRYDTYAIMVWNFLETIHDRCEHNDDLKATWQPVIEAENKIHRGWFLREMWKEWCREQDEGDAYRSAHKFCKPFRVFIFEHQWRPVGDEEPDQVDWVYREVFTTHPDFQRPAAPLHAVSA